MSSHYSNNEEKIINTYNNNLKKLTDLSNIFEKYSFDWEIYRALNKDLHRFTDAMSIYKHLYTFGLNEKRSLKIKEKYPTFDKNIYRENYEDLANMTDTELEKHYILIGVKENRVCDNLISRI
jgi:hypothetical protein